MIAQRCPKKPTTTGASTPFAHDIDERASAAVASSSHDQKEREMMGKQRHPTSIARAWLHRGALSLVALLSVRDVRAQTYTPQPAGEHSYLVDNTDDVANRISDSELAAWIADALEANYNSAVLIFGECFGGGMIDDINNVDAGLHGKPLFACSPSRHDEPSNNRSPPGLTDGRYASGESTFLHPFIDRLATGDRVGSSFTTARDTDVYGPNGTGVEHPESYSEADGGLIAVGSGGPGDAGASSFHAVLFVGRPNDCAHWTELVRTYQMLRAKNYPAANIAVLFGDATDTLFAARACDVAHKATDCEGVPAGLRPLFAGENADASGEAVMKPASKANLKSAIDALDGVFEPDSGNEQFFFWAFDHGTRTRPAGPGRAAPGVDVEEKCSGRNDQVCGPPPSVPAMPPSLFLGSFALLLVAGFAAVTRGRGHARS